MIFGKLVTKRLYRRPENSLGSLVLKPKKDILFVVCTATNDGEGGNNLLLQQMFNVTDIRTFSSIKMDIEA